MAAPQPAPGRSAAPEPITLAVLPDTQVLAAREPELYLHTTKWLAAHAGELDLAIVLHLGDVVDGGGADEAQYRLAARAHRTLLAAGLPLLVAAGNHDYDDLLDASRDLTMFNAHVGAAQLADRPWFGGSFEPRAAENCYGTLDAVDPARAGYLFVVLEFAPRPEVVAWASGVVAGHPDRKVVLVTHGYLDTDGRRMRPGSAYHPADYPATVDGLDGTDLWETTLRRWPNLVAVFCGHQVPEPVSYRVDLGDAGNPVLQSYQNWQLGERGGMGRLRIVRLDPRSGRVRMSVVNPTTDEVEKDDGDEVDLVLGPESAGLQYPPPPGG